MRIAIDVSPIKNIDKISHRVRGTGFYIENLKRALLKYFPDNQYTFFTRGESLPKNIDLVHYPYLEPFFLTLPVLKKNKTIVTVHDLTPLVFPKDFKVGLKGRLKWEIQKLSLKRVDSIIADSECSKKDIIKYTGIPESKVHVVYLAAGEEFKKVESSELKVENLRRKYNLPEKFALYVGDVTWNKNLPRLIGAIKEANIPLIMIGKALTEKNFDKSNPWNQDMVKVQRMIKEDKNIICPGFVPTEDLVMFYNKATVFVMPSLYEGFGLPVLEAMSCGCPVIISQEGSLPEIAGSAAFYVDAYDEKNISKGIKEVFYNKELQKDLSEKGLSRVKSFSWKKTAKETMNVYEKKI